MASNSTITTSSQVQSSGPSYYGGDGPTLPHLVGFTLAIVSLAIALGFLRVLLLGCRSRRLAEREAAMRLARRYDIEAARPTPVAQVDPPTKEQPRVMVVQPDEGMCCGLQLTEAGSKALQESSDSQNAAKLVDQASAAAQRL
ncbi:hypothetical protein COCOBI_13-2980 [Coccomyxa sp. Obi]|nr:hypothetical protein COCOBI_13-2980 [Coccomyxa sp. Obi]